MRIYIIGAGCGNDSLMTAQAKEAIDRCEIIIGSERLVKKYKGVKRIYAEYKAEHIKRIIDTNGADTAVLMSGDTGFYSGAKKLAERLEGYDVTVLPGISSATYFASRLKMSLEDWELLSLHGTDVNIIGYIRNRKNTFALLNNGDDVNRLCEKLILYGMDNVILHVGENLSYEDERIISGRASELKNMTFKKLCVVLAVNGRPENIRYQISDSEFIRGGVPMTKEEIRTLSLSKLGLGKGSVLYDIGAGTGSVGIAAALLNPDTEVYAFERNAAAVDLIAKNKIKFKADNVSIVFGEAQDMMDEFKTPTHAFIGGSGGAMGPIIDKLLELNDIIRIVINTVTLESLSTAKRVLSQKGIEPEITMVSVSRGENMRGYTLMKAENPVCIIAFGGPRCV